MPWKRPVGFGTLRTVIPSGPPFYKTFLNKYMSAFCKKKRYRPVGFRSTYHCTRDEGLGYSAYSRRQPGPKASKMAIDEIARFFNLQPLFAASASDYPSWDGDRSYDTVDFQGERGLLDARMILFQSCGASDFFPLSDLPFVVCRGQLRVSVFCRDSRSGSRRGSAQVKVHICVLAFQSKQVAQPLKK